MLPERAAAPGSLSDRYHGKQPPSPLLPALRLYHQHIGISARAHRKGARRRCRCCLWPGPRAGPRGPHALQSPGRVRQRLCAPGRGETKSSGLRRRAAPAAAAQRRPRLQGQRRRRGLRRIRGCSSFSPSVLERGLECL